MRNRITARERASADQTPYPGNVNQPDRKDKDWDKYHTFEQSVGHELPDLRHDWKNDERDDIGFGIPEEWGKSPTVASVRVAANKAVRIAVLLLGEKVSDETIEVQARDFMSMGPRAMDATLQRFAETQRLYASDEEDEKTASDEEDEKTASDDEDDKKVAKKGSDEEDEKTASDDEDDEKTASDEEDDKTASDDEEDDKKASDDKDDEKKNAEFKAMVAAITKAVTAALPDFIQKKVDAKKEKESKKGSDEEDEKTASDDEDDKKVAKKVDKKEFKKGSAEEDEKTASDDEEKTELSVTPKKTMGEMDIELNSSMEDEPESDPETEALLASLFDDEQVEDTGNSGRKTEASLKKSGIKKLGSQPRVASADGAGDDISSLWKSAPDVSDVFR